MTTGEVWAEKLWALLVERDADPLGATRTLAAGAGEADLAHALSATVSEGRVDGPSLRVAAHILDAMDCGYEAARRKFRPAFRGEAVPHVEGPPFHTDRTAALLAALAGARPGDRVFARTPGRRAAWANRSPCAVHGGPPRISTAGISSDPGALLVAAAQIILDEGDPSGLRLHLAQTPLPRKRPDVLLLDVAHQSTRSLSDTAARLASSHPGQLVHAVYRPKKAQTLGRSRASCVGAVACYLSSRTPPLTSARTPSADGRSGAGYHSTPFSRYQTTAPRALLSLRALYEPSGLGRRRERC